MTAGNAKSRFPFYILGIDPGTNNFAYSVHEITSVKNGVVTTKPLQRGLIFNTVRDLRSRAPRNELPDFIANVMTIIEKYPISMWIAERYMIRPGAGGSTIESINIMLGALAQVLHPLPFRLIPASEWKNAVQRSGHHTLVDLYQVLGAEDSVKVTRPDQITVHEIDACHIAEYGASIATNCAPDFHNSSKISKLAKPVHLGTRVKKEKPKPKPKKKTKK